MAEKNTQKKVVLISGATGYLGSEIARKLSEDGFCIAVLYNHDSEQAVLNLLKTFSGSGHKAYKCALEDPSDISETIKTIREKQGRLYALVHSAWAKSERKHLSACSAEEMSKEFNGNVLNSFNLISACAKIFKEQKEGIIVGITTAGVAIPEASKNLGSYMPAKYAVQGMLATLKEELSPFVEVYSVAPGFMHGGMNRDIPNAFVEMIRQKSPDKRITDASEVASVISSIFAGKMKNKKDMTILIAPEYDKN